MTLSLPRYNPCQPVIEALHAHPGQALRLADELASEIVGWDHDYAAAGLAVVIVGTALTEAEACTLPVMFERVLDRCQYLSFCKDLARRGRQCASRQSGALVRGVGVLAQSALDQEEMSPQTSLMARLRAGYCLRPFAPGSDLAALSAATTIRFRTLEDWRIFQAELSRASLWGYGAFSWAARQELARHGVTASREEMMGERGRL
jgi:hypothetical protein